MRQSLKDILKTSHIICISEGSADEVIIKKLFDNGKTIFKKHDMYNNSKLIRDFSRTREGRKFAKENLEKDYGEQPVVILRILDSKNEHFNLGKVYQERLKSGEIIICNILTRPEIEILIVINEGHYQKFTNKRGNTKPSTYCKSELRLSDVKKAKFISEYYTDLNSLVDSIKGYKRLHASKDEYCLYDLLET